MNFEQRFEEVVGLGFSETIIVIAVILITVDIFILTDITTLIAHFLFAFLVYWNLDEYHFLYRVIWGIVSWFILVGVHYAIWKNIIQKLTNRFITPDVYKSTLNNLLGEHGTFRVVDGKHMVSVKGDLWPCEFTEPVDDGELVEILDSQDGILTITLTKDKSK